MSRGQGKLQRAIAALFTPEFDGIYMLEDLVAAAFPGISEITKAQRVAAGRAAPPIAEACGYGSLKREAQGNPLVWYNLRSARSTAIALERSSRVWNDMTTEALAAILDGTAPHLDRPGHATTRRSMTMPEGRIFQQAAAWRAELAKREAA